MDARIDSARGMGGQEAREFGDAMMDDGTLSRRCNDQRARHHPSEERSTSQLDIAKTFHRCFPLLVCSNFLPLAGE
jgi:hypothetical protein